MPLATAPEIAKLELKTLGAGEINRFDKVAEPELMSDANADVPIDHCKLMGVWLLSTQSPTEADVRSALNKGTNGFDTEPMAVALIVPFMGPLSYTTAASAPVENAVKSKTSTTVRKLCFI